MILRFLRFIEKICGDWADSIDIQLHERLRESMKDAGERLLMEDSNKEG